jgi:AcrR family transcriptional regulator
LSDQENTPAFGSAPNSHGIGEPETQPSPNTARRKGANRREEILDAASQLFVSFGPSRTTTRQIAQAVGISQPSLYAHFPTKVALSHALATRAFSLLEARMEQTEAMYSSPNEHLEALIRGYIDFAIEESAAYKIAFMIDFQLSHEQIISLQELTGLRAFHIFKSKIEALQDTGFLKQEPSDVLAQSIWAAMHGLCALLLARPLFPWANRASLIDSHARLIIQGAQAGQ